MYRKQERFGNFWPFYLHYIQTSLASFLCSYSIPYIDFSFVLYPFSIFFFFQFSCPASTVRLASLKFFTLVKCRCTLDYPAMMDFNYLTYSASSYGLMWEVLLGEGCLGKQSHFPLLVAYCSCCAFPGLIWLSEMNFISTQWRNSCYQNLVEFHTVSPKNKIFFYLLETK